MGPRRSETFGRISKPPGTSLSTFAATVGGISQEQEVQQCTGKFAADVELCCRESSVSYPIVVPVQIRTQPSPPSQFLPVTLLHPHQSLNAGTYSATPGTPSLLGGYTDEHVSSIGKKTSRTRVPSALHNGTSMAFHANDFDARSVNMQGQEGSKSSVTLYRTFQLIRDSDYFRPKLLVDSANLENETTDQISALYMKDWQLDRKLIDVLKKVLPLQEQLHTLNFTYVGLNQQTIHGFLQLCQISKSLKNVTLDGNPSIGAYIHLLIDHEESKITNLSVRFCEITDDHVELFAQALGNMKNSNRKLLNLILSANQIGDRGAHAIAKALRYNRTLISLNLSSNFITDDGAIALASVLRSFTLTMEEILFRRQYLARRYAEMHPDESRHGTNSPTLSTVSTKSKSGRDSRFEWKRTTDPNKRKLNLNKLPQLATERRNRIDSDENRPPSGNKNDSKRGKNEGSSTRGPTAASTAAAISLISRRTPTNNTPTSNIKEIDQGRQSVAAKSKKITTATTATTKKNISSVKEEKEESNEEDNGADALPSGKGHSAQNQQNDRENPLLLSTGLKHTDGNLQVKGNSVLLSLNLSRNSLSLRSIKEFITTLQQQAESTQSIETVQTSSTVPLPTTASLLDFTGLCRLELKGIREVSTKSNEYQALEALLTQRDVLIRFHQFREREAKELLENTSAAHQPLQATLSDKTASTPDKSRIGSSVKSSSQRPSSRLKE